MTRKLSPQEKMNRKPINTACVFCHSKHLQCDVGRPCQNCTKRGIGETCRDKERKPRKRGPRKLKREGSVDQEQKFEKVARSDNNESVTTVSTIHHNMLVPVVNTAKSSVSEAKPAKVLKPKKPVDVATKRKNISKLAMDTFQLPLPPVHSQPESSLEKHKKIVSPELLPKIPSLTQLFNPTAEPVISDALLPSNQSSTTNIPSLVEKMNLEHKDRVQEQVADHLSLHTRDHSSNDTSGSSSGGEFGSVWTTEEYTKLNDMLSTPNLSRNGSKTYLNANATWSPSNMIKMDPIDESPNPNTSNNILASATTQNHTINLAGNSLRRTNSRPHISLDQMVGDSRRGDSVTDTSPESQSAETAETLTPYKFRMIVKSAEDLYKHQDLIQPHNYKSAYLELSKFLRSRFIQEGDKATSSQKEERDGPAQLQNIAYSIKSHYAPIFVTLTTNLIAQDLKLQELILQRALLEYESMAKLVNCTPMCIWRRSGEICFASNEFISLTGFSKKEILNQRKFIMEFMDNESIVDYYDIFHEYLAFGSTQGGAFSSSMGTSDGQAIFSECNLLLKNGCYLRCACIWTVKRDGFNIPMLIMGQFLPIFDLE